MSKATANPIGSARPPVNLSIPASLRNDVSGLAALYDAYTVAAEAMLGVMNEPRTEGEAHDTLEEDPDAVIEKAATVVQLLAALAPAEHQGKRSRARVLAHWAFLCGNGLDDEITAIVDRRAVC